VHDRPRKPLIYILPPIGNLPKEDSDQVARDLIRGSLGADPV